MLSLKNISFYYNKNQMILQDINLEVKQGELIAILGSSGSGKSTLLNLVAGLEKVSVGQILLDQKDITDVVCEKRNIGMIFQDYALFPHLTVEKNVGFALKSYKDPIVDAMLKLVKMESFKKRYPYELSGGEKQRVAIARSLAAQPKVLLLDEPFSNLDADLRYKVRKEVKEILTQANITSIMVTHDIDDAYDIADRIVFLKQGRIDRIEEVKATKL
ncbi:ABC transporter ATP-binding protein [Erysipelotrichaceae bacterium OH741_COT-311]|nr:ABC transporter ATP-binding protein [Erysipelotrichaceae bacterium OH741_COT-311]